MQNEIKRIADIKTIIDKVKEDLDKIRRPRLNGKNKPIQNNSNEVRNVDGKLSGKLEVYKEALVEMGKKSIQNDGTEVRSYQKERQIIRAIGQIIRKANTELNRLDANPSRMSRKEKFNNRK